MGGGGISDSGLATLILGWLAGAAHLPEFPIRLRAIEPHRDEDGQVDYFDIVTASGLRYRTRVELIQP